MSEQYLKLQLPDGEVVFEILDEFDFEGHTYLVLLHPQSQGNVDILEVVEGEDGPEYESVEDPELLMAIWHAFVERLPEEEQKKILGEDIAIQEEA